MSDQLLEQLKKAKERVHLSAERKASVRANLMEMIDGRVRANAALAQRSAQPNVFLAAFSPSNRLRAVTAVVVVLAMSGAGISLAAEKSRPGDTLYPVKVGVTENLRTAFAFSTESKAQVAVALAERRLEEASSLSAEGRLDAETEAELEEDFEEQADRAEEHIQTLSGEGKVQGAAGVAVRFEGVLRAQEAVLATLGDRNDSDNAATLSLDADARGKAATSNEVVEKNDTKKLGPSVRGRLNALVKLRAHLESDVDEDHSGENAPRNDDSKEHKEVNRTAVLVRTQVALAVKTAASASAFVRSESHIEGSAKIAAEARAASAVELAAEAQAKLDVGRESEAFALANAAIRAAAEARVLVNAEARLEGKTFFFPIDDERNGNRGREGDNNNANSRNNNDWDDGVLPSSGSGGALNVPHL